MSSLNPAGQKEHMDSAKLTILVAEDEDEMRDRVGVLLRGHGYHILEAANGWEALDVASCHHGPIHLLLTDISMPGLSGWELNRRIRSQRPGTVTLFMSSHFDSALRCYSLFLPKPFGSADLLSKVANVLKSGAYRGAGRWSSLTDELLAP
jgi:CheY-like chemotaxis protein